jgi:predicted ATP-grasp superfamily ATP-dependent carboligase
VTIPAATPWSTLEPTDPASFDMPAFADLPSAGDRIEKGHPILTFFETGVSTKECCVALEQRAQALDDWLYGC